MGLFDSYAGIYGKKVIIILNMFEFPDSEFDSVLLQLGRNIKINNSAYTKAIINNSKINLNADYRFIITKQDIKRGDIITWDNGQWLILSEVAQKQFTYYRAEMRKCNFNIKIIVDGIVREFSVIIDNKLVDYDSGRFFNLPYDRITVTMANNNIANLIDINDRFIKMNNAWKVVGKDLTRDGLIILHAEKDSIDNIKDDAENEIANANDYVYNLEITNGQTASVQADDTLQLDVVLKLNDEVSDKPIAFASSDTNICTVDSNGLVTAINEGTCIITAYMVDMEAVKDTIEITAEKLLQDNFTYEIVGEDSIKINNTKQYIANKYNNGVLVQDAEFDFSIIADDVPDDSYKLTIINDTVCNIECLKNTYYITLRAMDRMDNTQYIEKQIKLKSIF